MKQNLELFSSFPLGDVIILEGQRISENSRKFKMISSLDQIKFELTLFLTQTDLVE